MAARPAEGTQTVENEEAPGDCSGKKKSKFQAFKKLFVKKKRKESPAPSRESNLKPSQSSSDVSVSGANESAFQPSQDSVAKSGMGSKAVSHDSVFISEIENSTKEDTSQENTPGKVKALQLQLQQNIRIGSPPQGIVHKKHEDSGALSEDDGLPRSPPEITSLHEILALSSAKTSGIAQRRNSLSLGGTDSEDEPELREISSCPISPLNSSVILSSISASGHCLVDFTAPPSSVSCLDNSAVKHKIAVKPKKRKGPAMNVHRIKDGVGIIKDLQIKVKEKNENKVVSDHDVRIPHSGEVSAEQEALNEQAKCMENMVAEPETEITESFITQEEDSLVENTQIFETSFIGKQIMAETAESDVDFHTSCLLVKDPINHEEECTESQGEGGEVGHHNQSAPVYELKEITSEIETCEMEDSAVEMVHLEVSEDVECDVFEDVLRIQENTSVLEIDEPVINNKDEEREQHAKVVCGLTELKRDSDEITIGSSDRILILAPQKSISGIEAGSSIIKVDEHIPSVASECAVVCESTDDENTVDASKNTMPYQPRITDTSSTVSEEERSHLKIVESPTGLPVDGKSSSFTTGSITFTSGTNHNVNIQCTKEPSTEVIKVIKPTDSNIDSRLKSSNKPVRFTVAPAWQRSLSVGSSVKDTTYSKSKASSMMKSESFDASEDPVMDEKQEDCRKGEKNNEMTKSNEDLCVAFGVRLRRTSSSRKYEEYPEEQSKLNPSSVESGSMVPTRNVQTPTKAPSLHSDFPKVSKPLYTGEDKPRKKQTTQDLSSQDNSEPAWITMAKLKQKGFQGHPLARDRSAEAESDRDESGDKSSQKQSASITPQELDIKGTEPVSTGNPVVEESFAESGINAQSATPQNPDEPPWFSLAKKKAKAWSKMPQIVQ